MFMCVGGYFVNRIILSTIISNSQLTHARRGTPAVVIKGVLDSETDRVHTLGCLNISTLLAPTVPFHINSFMVHLVSTHTHTHTDACLLSV